MVLLQQWQNLAEGYPNSPCRLPNCAAEKDPRRGYFVPLLKTGLGVVKIRLYASRIEYAAN